MYLNQFICLVHRQGIDPYYIKPAQKLRKKAKEKRKAASAVKI